MVFSEKENSFYIKNGPLYVVISFWNNGLNVSEAPNKLTMM